MIDLICTICVVAFGIGLISLLLFTISYLVMDIMCDLFW